MYKWDLLFYMRNGSTLTGMYEGPQDDSGKVAELFVGSSLSAFVGCFSDRSKTSSLVVKNNEIIAMDIGPSKGEKV